MLFGHQGFLALDEPPRDLCSFLLGDPCVLRCDGSQSFFPTPKVSDFRLALVAPKDTMPCHEELAAKGLLVRLQARTPGTCSSVRFAAMKLFLVWGVASLHKPCNMVWTARPFPSIVRRQVLTRVAGRFAPPGRHVLHLRVPPMAGYLSSRPNGRAAASAAGRVEEPYERRTGFKFRHSGDCLFPLRSRGPGLRM